MSSLETDYLIVGAGASGLAFADEMLLHSNAHLTLVDRRAVPGGHWNDAYSFVRLHQPSVMYGVGSRDLGDQISCYVLRHLRIWRIWQASNQRSRLYPSQNWCLFIAELMPVFV